MTEYEWKHLSLVFAFNDRIVFFEGNRSTSATFVVEVVLFSFVSDTDLGRCWDKRKSKRY
jgi:hypothetical protein